MKKMTSKLAICITMSVLVFDGSTYVVAEEPTLIDPKISWEAATEKLIGKEALISYRAVPTEAIKLEHAQKRAEQLREIEAQLRGMNPKTTILPAQYCAIDPLLLLQSPSGGTPEPKHDHDGDAHADDLGFQTFSFKDERPMDRDRLNAFLDSLPPTLFRCKGYIRFHDASALLDFTGGRYRLTPVDDRRTTALTFIGRNCNSQEILDALHQCVGEEPPER